MNKKIIILLILFFLTGCSASYNLEIKDDMIYEKINIKELNVNQEVIDKLKSQNQYVLISKSLDLVYSKTTKINENDTIFTYSHKYTPLEFSTSFSNKCFDVAKFNDNSQTYSLYANKFNCFGDQEEFADSYKINIKTDYNVINNNADKIKGNIYTWNFTKQNYKNKSIVFQYTKTKKDVNYLNVFKPFFISILVSVIIALIIIFISKIKKDGE